MNGIYSSNSWLIMQNPNFYSAVFWIIKNEKWEMLFQKRQNTGFRDWLYQLPSWHLEWVETMKEAMIRELKEEINIIIKEEELEILHIAHVVSPNRVYFNIYMLVSNYKWEIKNLEPNKCSEIVFKKYDEIRNNPDFEYEVETLEKIFKWEKFSEKIVEKN